MATGRLSASLVSSPARIARSISTLTSSATLGAVANTDYTVFVNYPYADASFSSVTALLHGDGANNSTTITDSSPVATNFTVFNNAKLTTSNFKFGSASITFDALNAGNNSTRIEATAASASNFAFGAGDFTVEMWVYPTSFGVTRPLYDARPTSTQGAYLHVQLSSAGIPLVFVNNANQITGGSALSINTWYHIAVSRTGTSTKMFVNGTQTGSTYTDTTSYLNPVNRPRIGANAHSDNGPEYVGQIDEIRITKGVGRYTANFTAPTAAFDDGTTGTVTLPTAVSNKNLYTIKNVSAAPATPATTSSQTIDGAAPAAIAANGIIRLMSDGSNWRTV